MAFNLTDEQLMIQHMVREFSRKVVAPTAAERDRTKEFPADNLKKMADLGLLGMMVPVEFDGSAADTVGYVLALSEIAYSCASTAVVMSVHNSIVCESILNFATREQKEKYLKPLASGKFIGAFALTEPHAGSDPVSQSTTAVRDGDAYILNGTKRFTTTGKNAGLVIVTAKTDEAKRHKGISAFMVEQGTPGFIVGHLEDKMGLRASDTADLIFEDCRVPVDNLLGQEGKGFYGIMENFQNERLQLAVMANMTAQIALEESIKYARERHAFGRPLVGFQVTRHKLADMATLVEASREFTYRVAAKMNAGLNQVKEISMAKNFACMVSDKVTYDAVQIHGGAGYMREYLVERLYRDNRILSIGGGTQEIMKEILAKELLR